MLSRLYPAQSLSEAKLAFLIPCFLALFLSLLSSTAYSGPSKPGMVFTLQWWEGGEVWVKFSVDEKTASRLKDPRTAIRLMVVQPSEGDFSIEHQLSELDSGRTQLFRITLQGKGHIHIATASALGGEVEAKGKSPGGGIAMTSYPEKQKTFKTIGLYKDSPYMPQELMRDTWENYPHNYTGANSSQILKKHDELATRTVTGGSVVTYQFEGESFIKGSEEEFPVAFLMAETAMQPKSVPGVTEGAGAHAEVTNQMATLQIKKYSSSSGLRAAEKNDTFPETYLPPKTTVTNPPAQSAAHTHSRKKIASSTMKSPRAAVEALRALKPDDFLVKNVDDITLERMAEEYGGISNDFVEYLNQYDPSSSGVPAKDRQIPLMIFLQAARLAGSDTYDKLPAMMRGVTKNIVETFFQNEDYQWTSLSEKADIEQDEGVGVGETMDHDVEEVGAEMEGIVTGFLTAIKQDRSGKLGTGTSSNDSLYALLQKLLPYHTCKLQNEIKVGKAFYSRRITLKSRTGRSMAAEVRVYKVGESGYQEFDAAINAVASIAGIGDGLSLPKPLASYSGNGAHIQVVQPGYGYGDYGQVRTLQDCLASREVTLDEAVQLLERMLQALAVLHDERLVMDEIEPETIVRKYSKSGLSRIYFAEINSGIRVLSGDEDSSAYIKKDLFQIIKAYYAIRTRVRLDSIIDSIKLYDGRYTDASSLQLHFLDNPQDYQAIWRSWVYASGKHGVYVEEVDFAVLQHFFQPSFGWSTARAVLKKIRSISQHLAKGKAATPAIAGATGSWPGGYHYPHSGSPLDLIPLEQLPNSANISKSVVSSPKVTAASPKVTAASEPHKWRLTCDKGHVLEQRTVTNARGRYGTGVVCDICDAKELKVSNGKTHADPLRHGKLMSCPECNYDLCGPCAVGRMKVYALPPSVKCRKWHNMTFSQPVGKYKAHICDECKGNILQRHHYRCDTCYNQVRGGFDYCPNCAFWNAIKQEAIKGASGAVLRLALIPEGAGKKCDQCSMSWSSKVNMMVSEHDVLCMPCVADQLSWFGSYSAKFSRRKTM